MSHSVGVHVGKGYVCKYRLIFNHLPVGGFLGKKRYAYNEDLLMLIH